MKRLSFFCAFLIVVSACTSSNNSAEFIEKTEGRYLFNSDETIEVYFADSKMKVKWRGQDMTPIKANDSAFYLKEMNEKLVFMSTPSMRIELAPKREHKDKKYVFTKMAKGEKTPSEYFEAGEYDKAKVGYLAIQKRDSVDRSINQWSLNRRGYDLLRKKKYDQAKAIFEINIALYPKSSNTYDSMADFYRNREDTIKAIEFYKKALAINPENRGSKRQLKKLTEK